MNTEQQFLAAIESGDCAEVLQQLHLGADANVWFDEWRKTPLHKAVDAGQTEIVRLLLEHGAYVNAEDELWNTPLHYAAYRDKPEIVAMLLEYGAYVNGYAPGGPSSEAPLHNAARNGRIRNMEILLAHGADIEWSDDEDDTPLAVAAYHGEVEAMKFLLACGGDARRINRHGETPMTRALVRQQGNALRLLIEDGVQTAPSGENDWFRLAQVAMYGTEEELTVLVLAGININSADRNGDTVLHIAAEMGQP